MSVPQQERSCCARSSGHGGAGTQGRGPGAVLGVRWEAGDLGRLAVRNWRKERETRALLRGASGWMWGDGRRVGDDCVLLT